MIAGPLSRRVPLDELNDDVEDCNEVIMGEWGLDFSPKEADDEAAGVKAVVKLIMTAAAVRAKRHSFSD